jgi:hypothetical protein
MNFVPARRIITMHQHRSVGQLAKISRPPRMVEDHLLVKLFDFRDHKKKRTPSSVMSATADSSCGELSEAKHLWLVES